MAGMFFDPNECNLIFSADIIFDFFLAVCFLCIVPCSTVELNREPDGRNIYIQFHSIVKNIPKPVYSIGI